MNYPSSCNTSRLGNVESVDESNSNFVLCKFYRRQRFLAVQRNILTITNSVLRYLSDCRECDKYFHADIRKRKVFRRATFALISYGCIKKEKRRYYCSVSALYSLTKYHRKSCFCKTWPRSTVDFNKKKSNQKKKKENAREASVSGITNSTRRDIFLDICIRFRISVVNIRDILGLWVSIDHFWVLFWCN